VTGRALILQADALKLPLPDASVDLIVSSPPYFALRSYRDGDAHYAGQLGSEPTPQAFLEALWAVMHECWRVLKPTGSCFINLGDKRSGSGGPNGNGGLTGQVVSKTGANDRYATARATAPTLYTRAAFGRPKSKMLLPHRFAIGCEDGLADPEGKGWVVRSDIVWQKLNGLPESVTDRVRDSHEYLFHLTKSERYFAAVDEVREPHTGPLHAPGQSTITPDRNDGDRNVRVFGHALGKLPGSVWALPSEPLVISDEVKAHYDLPDHFAAFPTELVRRVILGWSPTGICTACGEGRRPVVAKTFNASQGLSEGANGHRSERRGGDRQAAVGDTDATITGYACRCATADAPTRSAVVLDPFSGTGTSVGVARALGRIGVGVDLSHDYSRLADYLVHRSSRFAKVAQRTHRENQGSMFGVPA
jgi:DNA modification methylase